MFTLGTNAIVAMAILLNVFITIAKYFTTKRNRCCKNGALAIAFFHPHCSAGGGGERVLWKQIEALGQLHEKGFNIKVVVYTSDVHCHEYHYGACVRLH